MEYPKIFDKQPRITKELLVDLERRGLIVPAKSLHKSERRTVEVANPTAGEVVGYSLLAKKFSLGQVSQDDARALLVLETTRKKGPRETHIFRFINAAFAADKAKILKQVEAEEQYPEALLTISPSRIVQALL